MLMIDSYPLNWNKFANWNNMVEHIKFQLEALLIFADECLMNLLHSGVNMFNPFLAAPVIIKLAT